MKKYKDCYSVPLEAFTEEVKNLSLIVIASEHSDASEAISEMINQEG